MGDIHNEGGAQKNAVETLQGKISCHKYEQELAEGESQQKKAEIEELIVVEKKMNKKEEKQKIEKSEDEAKIKQLDEAMKAKGKQLIDCIHRD